MGFMMKIKIPKKVNICGHDYSVQIVPQKKLNPGEAGVMRFPQRVILIAKEMSPEIRWLTFLHEIRHATQYETGMTQIFGKQLAETDCELFVSFITSLQKQGVL